jgi:ribosome maturation factor RimP
VVLRDRLTDLLEPVVNALGYELILLEFSPRDGSGLLRLFIDGPDGIGISDCEKVSREVAGVLDVEDPIRQAYQLEISSPGLDRPLAKPEHFQRFVGEIAKIQMLAPVSGRRRFQGVIASATKDEVLIETPEGVVTLPLADVEKARLVPNFDQKKEKTVS